MCRRLLPLVWVPGDACDVRGARGKVKRLDGDDVLVEVDGLPFWVALAALELVAMPAATS